MSSLKADNSLNMEFSITSGLPMGYLVRRIPMVSIVGRNMRIPDAAQMLRSPVELRMPTWIDLDVSAGSIFTSPLLKKVEGVLK